MKTKLIGLILLLSVKLFAQETDTTLVDNSLKNEKQKGVFENNFKFYGVEIDDEKDNYVIRFKNRRDRKSSYKRRTVGVFDIDFGVNHIEANKDAMVQTVANPEFNLWHSSYFSISMNAKTRMFGSNSPLYLNYGLGLQWDNYSVKGNYILTKSQNGIEYIADPSGNSLDESNLKNYYMTAPLMLQFDFSKNGVDNGFKLGVGAYAGVRFYTYQNIEYKDADGDVTKLETRNKMHVNPFNYGLQAEIGYGIISLHAKYELSPFFDVDNPYDYQIMRFGVKFSL